MNHPSLHWNQAFNGVRNALLGVALGSTLLHVSAHAQGIIHGAGSTAAAPIYQAWAAEYQKVTGVSLTYEAIGSSAGLKKMAADAVHFGASDVAPNDADLAASGWVLIPVAITGIAPLVNLPTLRLADTDSGSALQLSGDLLARIFAGEVTRWNAAPIAALNPQLKLPDLPITVVVRGDGSGTTYNFTDYLSKVNARWRSTLGTHSTIEWPGHVQAVKGSNAVVAAVRATVGAIGYVDFGYVQGSGLGAANLLSADGDKVTPGIDAFKAALTHSEWVSKGHFNTTLTQQPGKGSWPITMGTFAVVPQSTRRPEDTLRALRFLAWSFMQGDRLVQLAHFVRLPDRVQAAAFKAMSSVKDQNGTPVGTQILAP